MATMFMVSVATWGVVLYTGSMKGSVQLARVAQTITQAPAQPATLSRPAMPPKVHDPMKPPRPRNLVFSGNVKMQEIIDTVNYVIRFTNEERVTQRLAPLQSSAALAFMAQIHSENMCENKTLEHDANGFPDGWKKLQDRLKLFGLRIGDENIAQKALQAPETCARDLVKEWMTVRGQRQNILSEKWKYIGVGICPCVGNTFYAVQVFADQEGEFH
jgi:uncharacterized protein YkwD